jgi:cell division protein ZapE
VGFRLSGAAMDVLAIDPALLAQGPLPAYRARLAGGDLAPDPAQELAAERLQELWVRLRGYDPGPKPAANGGLFARFMRSKPAEGANEDHPGGLYLVGEVGRGKSMLMDLFFAAARVARKRRTHFHRFMQDVHRRIHASKQASPNGEDPIPPLADAIATEAALLCFDEFQVNDIADAMILGRLFQALFERAVVVVATSNTPPDDLFKGQPGRDAFLPFIALLKQNLDVLVMEAGRDYRRERLRGMPTWYVPADAKADAALDEAWRRLAGGHDGLAQELTLLGRSVHVPRAFMGVARFGFRHLCEEPLAAADYLRIAREYHTIVLDHVPAMSYDNRNAAKRFIILIDTLYDMNVKLIASAAAEPDALYRADEGFEAQEFKRTASRLIEMRSQAYLAQPHGAAHARTTGSSVGIVET